MFIWSGTTSIVGSTFSKSTGTAIFVHSSAVTVKNNSVTLATEIGSNNDPAIVVTSSSLNLANLVGDSLSGTGNVGFQIDGTLGTSGTLPAESYPWEIGLASSAGTVGSVTVPSGVTLSISAGTIVKSWSGTIAVQGTLSAVGTTSEPIVFTSLNDDSVGGTDYPGSPAAGDWGGIAVTGNANIQYSIFKFAGDALDLSASPGVNDAVHDNWLTRTACR